MGRKIFVSYKYADNQVKNLSPDSDSTVRDYVNLFEEKLDSSDDIYKGESDGEDLSELSEDTIWEKLKNKIYDSSVTIVFISPGMKEDGKSDKYQWIPWEISYSLKETQRKNKKGEAVNSHTNAMLAVVLPDKKGSYEYYLETKSCCSRKCVCHHTEILFNIISNNKFNKIKSEKLTCSNGSIIWNDRQHSYIKAVKWCDFIQDYKKNINLAIDRKEKISEYEICKSI